MIIELFKRYLELYGELKDAGVALKYYKKMYK